MDDLTTRLIAAIDERERWAKAASTGAGRWTSGPDSSFGGYVVGTLEWAHTRTQKSEQALHIQKNDPASVLRRCAADRRIVERHVKVVEMWDQGDERGLFGVEICRTCAYGTSCGHCFERDDLPLVAWPCPTLLDLAEGYGITEETDNG